jgi:hypothetical protein
MTAVGIVNFRHDAIDRAARWIQAYDAQGVHRSTSPADERSAEWLASEAAEGGAHVQVDEFPLSVSNQTPPMLKLVAFVLPVSRSSIPPSPTAQGSMARLATSAAMQESRSRNTRPTQCMTTHFIELGMPGRMKESS